MTSIGDLVSVSETYGMPSWTGSRRRSGRTNAVLAAACAMSTLAAIAASAVYYGNASRLARYQSDVICPAPLTVPVADERSVCAVETVETGARWVRTYRGTPSYRAAFRAPGGSVDSVELLGNDAKDLWDAAQPGTSFIVQRFWEDDGRRHITIVQRDGLVARTPWNPAWRRDDAMAGVVFLSLVAVGSLIGLVAHRVRERRDIARNRLFEQALEA